MRTRIALVAIAPIAVITTTVLMQAATVQPVGGAATSVPSGATSASPGANSPSSGATSPSSGATSPSSGATTTATSHQPADRPGGRALPTAASPGGSSLVIDLRGVLLARPVTAPASSPPSAPVPAAPVAPAPAPTAPTGPVDTVTPAERAAWERVAMCEEGGNWHADSPRFSGGLGISRANWDAYGGRQFAPEGAMASEDQQIMVAERIQGTPPDQYGCRGW